MVQVFNVANIARLQWFVNETANTRGIDGYKHPQPGDIIYRSLDEDDMLLGVVPAMGTIMWIADDKVGVLWSSKEVMKYA